MGSKGLTALEKDAIGEILNISLGASATAVSNMLGARVDITTPQVNVENRENFDFSSVEPAVGVEITYVEGIEGSNIMLLKRHDVKVIVEMMMMMEIPDSEFELNEMNISAICELMNQMMGASATALSEFFSKTINISTPVSFEVQDRQEFIDKYFENNEEKAVVSFSLKIEDKLESEFLNVMSIELAKSLVKDLLPPSDDDDDDEEEEETPVQPEVQPQPVEQPAQPQVEQQPVPQAQAPQVQMPAGMGVPDMQNSVPGMMGMPPQGAADISGQMPYVDYNSMAAMQQAAMNPMYMQTQQQMLTQMMEMQKTQQMLLERMQQQPKEKEKPAPKTINVRPTAGSEYKNESGDTAIQEENQELIMGVPLEISVEIGRTRKLVKEILEFTQGSLVVLDKLAGEQADIFVNGRRIAKGDVVVVEDSFGVRITEIVDADSNG